MAASDGRRATYSSLSKLEKKNTQFNYDDDNLYFESTRAESKPSNKKKEFLYQFSDAEDLFDGGYESSDDSRSNMIPSIANMPPEVNLKNVLSGVFAILTGQNKTQKITANQQCPSSNVSFLGSRKNGDIVLDSSVYTPSAPPLFEPNGIDYSAYKEVLEAEPPEWLPDSYTTVCMQCSALFTAFTQGRHHCRFCGGVFCRACTKGRCLLPVRFREREPQRVCDACYDRLDPLQGVLINTISNAAQVAKHDVMDWTCARGWLKLPIGLSLEHEIYKSSNTLRSYCEAKSRLHRWDFETEEEWATYNEQKEAMTKE